MSGARASARAPRTLAIADAGGATSSVAVLGSIDGQWRLLGALAAPAGIPEDAIVAEVRARVSAADPALARDLDLEPGARAGLPWLRSQSRQPATALLLGATRRSVGLLEEEGLRTGFRCIAAPTETHDPRELTALALRREVSALVIGAGDPPGPDERVKLEDLAALGAAVAHRRPDLPIVLTGAMRTTRSGGSGPGPSVRAALEALWADPVDGRQALRRSAESLADLFDLRVEVVEVGFDGACRVFAEPGAAGAGPRSEMVVTARGGLVPEPLDEAVVDGVLAWTTGSHDRHRMTDRLRELRERPWADGSGDGARLRLAAASAALARLADLTPAFERHAAPDLTIIAGGAFASAPPAAIAIAVAGTIRRGGATQLAWDHARLLGPIGTIESAAERRALLADVAGDALLPIGTVIVAGGLGERAATGARGGRPAARVHLESGGAVAARDIAGGVAILPLGPGEVGSARFEFTAPVRLGRRTRRVTVPVTGGLAGVVVDLRDVPLRLPERRDRRRRMIADLGTMTWPGDDR